MTEDDKDRIKYMVSELSWCGAVWAILSTFCVLCIKWLFFLMGFQGPMSVEAMGFIIIVSVIVSAIATAVSYSAYTPPIK